MDFIRWYRKVVESARQEPPPAVWEEIQNELDIEAVWKNLEKELPVSRPRKNLFFILSAAASILVLIAVGALFLVRPAGNVAGQFSAVDNNNHDIFSEHPERNENLFQTLLSPVSEFPLSTGRLPAGTLYDSVAPGRRTIPAAPVYSPGILEISAGRRMNKTENLLIAGTRSDHSSLPGSAGSNIKMPDLSGYYAGVTGHLANTWLLNNKTLQGLKSDDLTSSLPSFGYSFGIIAGRTAGHHFDIQAEAYFFSLARQGYNEYLHGQYVNNLLQFNYSRIALTAKWHFVNISDQKKHSLLLGTYAGLLKNALQDLNGEALSLYEQYRTADFGIIAGYEYLHPLANRFSLGTGLRTNLGLNNIFAGNEIVPGYLNNTRNASINFIISLRYDLK